MRAARSTSTAPPAVYCVFGATGDLSRRSLLPALFRLHQSAAAPRCYVLGVTHQPDVDDDAFRTIAEGALIADGIPAAEARAWAAERLFFQPVGKGTPDDFAALGARLEVLEREQGLEGNRVFYLALPPKVFAQTISGLAAAGLARSPGWTRLVIEKPFGRDLESAARLNEIVHEGWQEAQVYRIDHFLGKETVQNLLVFRFANAMFESLWNRDRVASVQITVSEVLGVEQRAGYYESAGVLRDMIQNHLTQLLTLVAMEPPSVIAPAAIRAEKVKALQAVRKIDPAKVVRGQYVAGAIDGSAVPAYRDEPGVASDSSTATFIAMRMEVDSWRWQGVPFLLRTGKRMPRRLTEIVLNFREPPVSLFEPYDACQLKSDTLVMRLQPDEGFTLYFDVKTPGPSFQLSREPLHFDYADAFGALPDAYETLLLDVLEGDQTLFVHAEEVEASWRLYTPLLDDRTAVRPYAAGTWGPPEADALTGGGALRWRNP